jgi:branched-subunit amino acid ABC-type transport system permease component
MREFLNFTLGGVSFGMIYAAIGLSLVLIWRATRILNYAQGGMAMLSAFVALTVIHATGSYWAGFAAALAAGLVLGVVVERVVIRPVEKLHPWRPYSQNKDKYEIINNFFYTARPIFKPSSLLVTLALGMSSFTSI